MEIKSEILNRLLNKPKAHLIESINDLRDKEFGGVKLTAEEKFALSNFDKYRLNILNSQKDEDKFHQYYRQLHVIANLGDWREFLKEEFYS